MIIPAGIYNDTVTWPRGKAEVCKTFYDGSNPSVTSKKQHYIMLQQPECPVDFVTVNEYKIRVMAVFVFVISVSYLLVQHWALPLFLVYDFGLRAFNGGKYGPLQILGSLAEKSLPLAYKATDRGPKRFAAAIGFVIALLAFFTAVLQFAVLSLCLTTLIVLFSFLEFSIGFCAGCYLYALIKRVRPFKK
jgi:hypothetical protein